MAREPTTLCSGSRSAFALCRFLDLPRTYVTCPPKTGPTIMRVLGANGPGKDSRMRRSRFSDEQITTILKEHEAGGGAAAVCRRHGISEQTLYRWKAKYGGMPASETKR